MIVLFTDLGLHGPYTGQMKAVLHERVPASPVIDLFADAPAGNPKASAYLLAAYAAWFSAGTIFLCVVDPGVGGKRPAIILEADSRWYVGPGNGLFELVQRRAEKTQSFDIAWKPELLSASFHGRDLFAPVAAPAAIRRRASHARIARIAGQTGLTTSRRSSTSTISATP
jgi:S-adenosyl-L-methionine hydrolase (adenosine-forming)